MASNSQTRASRMGSIRGLILIIFGLLALYRGWTMHGGERALLTYALGALALAWGMWRIRRGSGDLPRWRRDP